MRPPTQANAPQIAIGPTGNGIVVWQEPEINGVARIWARRLFGRTLDYVMPVSADELRGRADRRRRRCAERGGLAARPGRGRLPAGRRPRLAAAGAAHLPEHAARRRIGQRRGVHRRERRRRGGGGRRGRVDRAAEHRHRRKAGHAPALRQQRHAAGDRGQRSRALRQRSRSGPPFAGAEPLRGERHEPGQAAASRRGRAPTPTGARPSRCARTSPAARVQTGAGQRRRGRADRRTRGRSLGARRRARRVPARVRSAMPRSSRRRSRRRRCGSCSPCPKAGSSRRGRRVSWQPAVSANGPLRYTVVLDGRKLATRGALSAALRHPRGLASGEAHACSCSQATSTARRR